jgi:hypothetical protein
VQYSLLHAGVYDFDHCISIDFVGGDNRPTASAIPDGG